MPVRRTIGARRKKTPRLVTVSGRAKVTRRDVRLADTGKCRLDVTVVNGSKPVSVGPFELMSVSSGGAPAFLASCYGSGALFAFGEHSYAAGQSRARSVEYTCGIDASHFLLWGRASAAGATQDLTADVPIRSAGSAAPPKIRFNASPLHIGLWNQPVEAVPAWLIHTPEVNGASSVWIVVAGQLVQHPNAGSIVVTRLHLRVATAGKVWLDEALPLRLFVPIMRDNVQVHMAMFHDRDGHVGLTKRQTHFHFGRRLPSSFGSGTLALTIEYVHGATKKKSVLKLPVKRMALKSLSTPVHGYWFWGNSIDSEFPHAHSWLHQKYSFDIGIVRDGKTFKGDPDRNESFYCWDKPIYAMAAGRVLQAVSRFPDNFGRTPNKASKSNFVILEHDGYYTVYHHLRQKGVVVRKGENVTVGQLIGYCGNSGGSTEPHLHIGCLAIDQTGRLDMLPIRFTNLYTVFGTRVPRHPGKGIYLGRVPPQKVQTLSPATLRRDAAPPPQPFGCREEIVRASGPGILKEEVTVQGISQGMSRRLSNGATGRQRR